MWVQHIHHLLRIAQNRQGEASGELQSHLLWYVLYLDSQACLAGNGNGDFVKAFVDGHIILPDWRQIKDSARVLSMQPAYPNEQSTVSAAIYNLSNGTCALDAKMAVLAQSLRTESARGFNPQVLAAQQHAIAQMRNEFYTFWATEYPSFLQRESPQAAAHLPVLPRLAFEYVRYLCAFAYSIWRLTLTRRHSSNTIPT